MKYLFGLLLISLSLNATAEPLTTPPPVPATTDESYTAFLGDRHAVDYNKVLREVNRMCTDVKLKAAECKNGAGEINSDCIQKMLRNNPHLREFSQYCLMLLFYSFKPLPPPISDSQLNGPTTYPPPGR